MLPANTYVMRLATEQDADDLRRLAALDAARPLTGRILIGEIDGAPAAALSLKTSRTIADPFQATDRLRVYLRVRAAALQAVDREPSLRERMLDAVRRPAAVRSMA
jgi:hypothetical protein